MRHTVDPHAYPALAYVCEIVCDLEVDHHVQIPWEIMRDIPANGEISPSDRVLDNIIGSRFTHSMRIDERTGEPIYSRHNREAENR